MDDPRWLRLITVGLVLVALVVGYSLLTGSFVKSKPAQKETQISNETVVRSPSPSINPSGTPSATPASSSGLVNGKVAERNQGGNIQILPKTGFPVILTLAFSLSAIVTGWSLRKFPH